MSNVDWSTAPEGAEFYDNDELPLWYKIDEGKVFFFGKEGYWAPSAFDASDIREEKGFYRRPQQWPETDERISAIAQNGNDGLHYNAPERAEPVSAADFLSEGLKTLSERGKQYDPNGKKELSFKQVAQAFNAVTGKAITGADVCLMLVMLKIVRQNAAEGFHLDSAVDGVNYMALWAELLSSSDHTQPKTAP